MTVDHIEGPFSFGTHVEGVPEGTELAFGPPGEDGLPDNEYLVYIRREMTNPKGARFEALVTDYINEIDLDAVRTGSAEQDQGDIHYGVVIGEGNGEWTIEAKDQAEIDLPGFIRQLEDELARREAIPFKGSVVIKNRRHGVEDAYAAMSFRRYRQLVAYVIMLELVAMDYTGNALPVPDALRAFLGGSMAEGRNAHLLPAFGEFVQFAPPAPEPAALTGDECPFCGQVHTDEQIEDYTAFFAALLGIDLTEDAGAGAYDPANAGTVDAGAVLAVSSLGNGGEVSSEEAVFVDE